MLYIHTLLVGVKIAIITLENSEALFEYAHTLHSTNSIPK